MPRTDYIDVPKTSNYKCIHCDSKNLEYCMWESYDEAHEDYHYHCKDCNEEWWIEGLDS